MFFMENKNNEIKKKRFLRAGLSFFLIQTGKLGNHPESKEVLKTTKEIENWLFSHFEIHLKKNE